MTVNMFSVDNALCIICVLWMYSEVEEFKIINDKEFISQFKDVCCVLN